MNEVGIFTLGVLAIAVVSLFVGIFGLWLLSRDDVDEWDEEWVLWP